MDHSIYDKRRYPIVGVRGGYGEWVRTYEQTVQDEMDLRLLERLRTVDWSAPRSVLDLACGTGQWIRYSTNAAATLSGLKMPLLVVQCLSDETLPGHTLARNLADSRAVTAANRNARLRELPGHDHLGMRPGEREPSVEFMAVVLGWLGPTARPSPR